MPYYGVLPTFVNEQINDERNNGNGILFTIYLDLVNDLDWIKFVMKWLITTLV